MIGGYQEGYARAIEDCAQIAERWRDENKAELTKARIAGRKRHAFNGDETMLVMAEQLEGAMNECNAIAQEIRARAASADTRPEGGDSTKIEAPFTGGAVPHEDAADAQPTPVSDPISNKGER